MLNNGKKIGDRGRPSPIGGGVIIHFRDELDSQKGWGKGSGPLGGEDRQSLEQYQDAEVMLGVVA